MCSRHFSRLGTMRSHMERELKNTKDARAQECAWSLKIVDILNCRVVLFILTRIRVFNYNKIRDIKKQTIIITLSFLLIFGDGKVFQCIDWRIVCGLYWEIPASLHMMTFVSKSSMNRSMMLEQAFFCHPFIPECGFSKPFCTNFCHSNLACKIFLTFSLLVFTMSAII